MKNGQKRYYQKKFFATVIVCSVLLIAGLICVSAVYAADPGSNDDPIALKSYVDSKLSALESKLTGAGAGTTGASGESVAAIETKLAELTKKVEVLSAENETLKKALQQGGGAAGESGTAGMAETNGTDGSAYLKFQIFEVKSGERVLMGASTEIVVRTGKAQAIRGEFGGVIDLITGEELGAGAETALNHLLLSARSDGRGLRFTENSFVMIKGDFDLR